MQKKLDFYGKWCYLFIVTYCFLQERTKGLLFLFGQGSPGTKEKDLAKTDIASKAEQLLLPILEDNGFELVDTEYVKEGSDFYLRAYIDKEGGITIDDCELVSRAFEVKLDEEDFIADAYILEVSSPGLTRPLKKPRDFERNLGKPVEVHLYKPVNKQKEFVGELKAYDDDKIVIETNESSIEINKSDISIIKQYFEW